MERDVTEQSTEHLSVAIVVLAAGHSTRMGGHNKLLAEFDGKPLVRRVTQRALSSGATSVTVVTGHRQAEIEAASVGLGAELAHNADHESGMASSLVTGFSAPAAQRAAGVLVMLADMPNILDNDLKVMIAAFRLADGKAIVRAASNGKPGNPVILPQVLRGEVLLLEGDLGARYIIETSGIAVLDVDIGDAAHLDVDTPVAVAAAGGVVTT